MVKNVLAHPFPEDPRLVHLLFEESGSSPGCNTLVWFTKRLKDAYNYSKIFKFTCFLYKHIYLKCQSTVTCGYKPSKCTFTLHSFNSYLYSRVTILKQYNRSILQPEIIGAKFTWHGQMKTKGSFFMRVSPELDLALYSICALTKPNAICSFNMAGQSIRIQTWDVSHKAGSQIASAYPAI